MSWIWSEGVRKLPWWSRTSHVRAFKICSRSKLIKNLLFPNQREAPQTDRFQSDGREEAVDDKVDLLGQVGHTEVLQQIFLAAQTVDQHVKP